MPVHKRMVFLPGRAIGGLAVLAAVLLAPGAARAQNAICGALSSGAANCPNAAYATGIIYWYQTSGVTLTVPGTATGTTITTSTAAWAQLDNGISIHTSTHASEARDISLTVGSTGATVAIVQGSSPDANTAFKNHGIHIAPETPNGSTITVDVKSGVTIGASGANMDNRGIDVVAPNGAGAVSVTSAATIYSDNQGIYISNAGAGAVTVTNSGAITTGDRGIHALDSGSAGAITVISSGAITSSDTSNDQGIYARTTGKDTAGTDAGVSITHSAGAIAVTGGIGIGAHVGEDRRETDAMHADYVAPENEGLAKVEVTGGSIAAKGGAIQAMNYEAGSVEVSVSEGVTLTSSHGHGIEAALTDVGNTSGTITVTNAAAIKAGTDDMLMAPRHGIRVNRAAGSGNVSVSNTGDVEANGYGIFAVVRGDGGALEVTNSGAIGTAADRVTRGIFVSHDGNPGADGSASLEVTHSAGAVLASDYGVFAQVAAVNSADLTVGITGGSVSVDGHRPAVEAVQ